MHSVTQTSWDLKRLWFSWIPAFCENGFLGIALRLAAVHSCNPQCVNGILGQFVLPSYVHAPFPSTQEISAEKREWFPLQQNQSCDSHSGRSWPCRTAHSDCRHGEMEWQWCAKVQILLLLKIKLKWVSHSVGRMIGLLGLKWLKFNIRNGTAASQVDDADIYTVHCFRYVLSERNGLGYQVV